jgi:hypothetical protein
VIAASSTASSTPSSLPPTAPSSIRARGSRFQVRPPPILLRAPIIELASARNVGWAISAPTGAAFHVEDERGERLVDAHAEAHHAMAFALPAGRTLFLHTAAGEAAFRLAPGEIVRLDRLRVKPRSLAARDALSSALERGLFVSPFGPDYYRGFVDREGEVSVSFPTPAPPAAPRDDRRAGRRVAGVTLFAISAAGAVTSLALGGVALAARADYEATTLQRPAAEARARYDSFRAASGAAIGVAAALALTAAIVHPWSAPRPAARPAATAAISIGPDGAHASIVGRF